MPISSVDGSSSTQDPTKAFSSQTTSNQGSLDKQAFLKLLVAQLSHQDPLKPMEGTEFVTQLAQFTSVEQQIIQSQKLDMLSTQMSGLAGNEAASLVGKRVTIQGKSEVNFDGNLATSQSFTLKGAAESVKVDIKDANGNTVRTIDMKSQAAGPVGVVWDGKSDSGAKMPAGKYTMDVHATDKSGANVDTAQQVSGTVVKVTFEKGYPEVVLDSGVTAPLSDLISVGNDSMGGGTTSTATLPSGGASALLAGSALSAAQVQGIKQMLDGLTAKP